MQDQKDANAQGTAMSGIVVGTTIPIDSTIAMAWCKVSNRWARIGQINRHRPTTKTSRTGNSPRHLKLKKVWKASERPAKTNGVRRLEILSDMPLIELM
jgi:hypothetical protein